MGSPSESGFRIRVPRTIRCGDPSAGMDHPVEADVGCRNTVFHAASQSAADLVPRLMQAGVRRFRVELVRESAAETARIVEHYRRLVGGTLAPADLWRALRTGRRLRRRARLAARDRRLMHARA